MDRLEVWRADGLWLGLASSVNASRVRSAAAPKLGSAERSTERHGVVTLAAEELDSVAVAGTLFQASQMETKAPLCSCGSDLS